jgi:metallophosphoesterase (TIGR03767 family)
MVTDPAGTTLEATIVPVGGSGYQTLTDGPGWPFLVRNELSPAKDGREDRRTALAAFVHLTDIHLVDTQSPGRVEFLDDVDPLFMSAVRPQETLSTQVGTSMVQRINSLAKGPVTGRAFDMAVSTGDNIDNQQLNELDWFMGILDGGQIVPDSGALGSYEGVQDGVALQAQFWHPEPGLSDSYKTDLGFPDVPGLLDRAIVPFTSPGLDIPWYSTYGNHDCNIQGNGARSDAIDAIFTGDRKITDLKVGEDAIHFILRVFGDSPSVLADLQAGAFPFRSVTADADRRTATTVDWVTKHLDSPKGTHGYSAANADGNELYYSFQVAPGVLGISLDTTNHAGGATGGDGAIGEGQLAWMESQIRAVSSKYVSSDGYLTKTGAADQLVIVFSHHTSGTMTTDVRDPRLPDERRIMGPELVSVLQRYPNVVAWVNGHTHTNGITPQTDPLGHTSGFWEINTASHIDYPEQARIVELVDNGDGTLSIFCTLIEHAAPAAADRSASDVIGLAAISRELSFNDVQAGPLGKLGGPESHNVELLLPTPFVVGVPDRPAEATSTTTSPDASTTSAPNGGTSAPATTSGTGTDGTGYSNPGTTYDGGAAQPVYSTPTYTG